MSKERYLVDTNILLRAAEPNSVQHTSAAAAVAHLLSTNQEVHIAPQNLIEFWVVATRPQAVNGLGWITSQAQTEIIRLQAALALLPDTSMVFGQWEHLVTRYAVQGVQAHDCRLVAFMLVHGITHLLTFNASHFKRFIPEGITIVEPADVITQ